MYPRRLRNIQIAVLSLAFVLFASIGPIQAKSRTSGYSRVTVGTVEIKDWQRNILNRYPNLNHYHWNPMYANVQGWNKVYPSKHSIRGKIPGNRKKKGKKKAFHKKPTYRKISPRYVKYRKVSKRTRNIYKKTNLVAKSRKTKVNYKATAPRKAVRSRLNNKKTIISYSHMPKRALSTRLKPRSKTVAGNLASRETGLKLHQKKTAAQLSTEQLSGRLANPEPLVKSYKPYQTSPSRSYNKVSGNLANKRVKGKINW